MLLHFGLDAAESVDSIVVWWPSGQMDRLGPHQARRGWVIEEAEVWDSSGSPG
jgi:hypothetical protein